MERTKKIFNLAAEEVIHDLVVKKLIANGAILTISSMRVVARASLEDEREMVVNGANIAGTEKPMLSVVASALLQLGQDKLVFDTLKGFLAFPCRIVKGELTFKALDIEGEKSTFRLRIRKTTVGYRAYFDNGEGYRVTIERAISGEIF